jgi:hypothetical protein
VQADAPAAGGLDGRVVEWIGQFRQAAIGTQGRSINFRGALHTKLTFRKLACDLLCGLEADQSLHYPGLGRDTLNTYCDGVLDGQEIPRRDGKPAQLMRQLLLEMLKEESWIETAGETTQEADIRKLIQKTAPDPVVVTAVRPASHRPSAMSC